jgi:hypothetical protein
MIGSLRSALESRLCKKRDVYGWAAASSWPARPVSCADCFQHGNAIELYLGSIPLDDPSAVPFPRSP